MSIQSRATSAGQERVPRRRGRGGEDGDAPQFSSYYGLPVLNEPVWQARDIAGYLFLGGLAGASSSVAALAHLSGRGSLARVSKIGAAGAIALSMGALVHDLGRPSRFVNMLRVVKVTSPMNMGSWLLSAFAPAAAVAAVSDMTGYRPGVGTVATVAAGAMGPAVAAYTAALICDTAVPSWHDGFREMPFVFVASAASAAAGLGLLAAPVSEQAPLRRLALVAGPAEIALTKLMERNLGMMAEPYRRGKAGIFMSVAEALTALGCIGVVCAGRRRDIAAAAGAALLAGSALERFGIFHAGVSSARQPEYTVVPQRERIRAATHGA